MRLSATTLDEDRAICEAVQRNLDAGVYDTGLLSPRHEQGVAAFQRWVAEWSDLMEFEIVPVVAGKDTGAALAST